MGNGVTLELKHNHGTEKSSENFKGYHPGNQEKDGYGHVAFSCDDINEACDRLVKAGVSFKKLPHGGRMKNLAFAYDPDGYWVEITQRHKNCGIRKYFNFAQTAFRVKDPKKTIEFYEKLGMKNVYERHFETFSLFFLASNHHLQEQPPKDNMSDEAHDYVYSLFNPILELMHNHGTENGDDFQHYNGNEKERAGFGHVGFLVDDVYIACDAIRSMGYGFRKEPDGGSMKGLAFAYDPDGYSVEIIKRGGIEFNDVKKA